MREDKCSTYKLRMVSMNTAISMNQCFSTRVCFTNQGTFDNAWRYIWLSQLGSVTYIRRDEAKDAIKYFTIHRISPTTKNYLAHNVYSETVDKSYNKQCK